MLYVHSETNEIIEFVDQIDKDSLVFRAYNGRLFVVQKNIADNFKIAKGKDIEAAWYGLSVPIISCSSQQTIIPNIDNDEKMFFGLSET